MGLEKELDTKTILAIQKDIDLRKDNPAFQNPDTLYDFLTGKYSNKDPNAIKEIIDLSLQSEQYSETPQANFEEHDFQQDRQDKQDIYSPAEVSSIKPIKKKRRKTGKIVGTIGAIGICAFLTAYGLLNPGKIEKTFNKIIRKQEVYRGPMIPRTSDIEPEQKISETPDIPYIGPNNANQCTIDVYPARNYESRDLELIINSDDPRDLSISDKAYGISSGKNEIFLQRIKDEIIIRAIDGFDATFNPTKISCQNKGLIKIENGREIIVPEQEVYIEKLKHNFKGNAKLYWSQSKEFEDSLNSSFKKFTLKNREGRIYSFNIIDGKFNAFCGKEDLFFNKIYLDKGGELIESETELTGKFKISTGDDKKTENLNIPISRKKVPVIINSGHSWPNPEIFLISTDKIEYIINSEETFKNNILFEGENKVIEAYPGFYLAHVEIPERSEWIGRRAFKACKKIMVFPGEHNNFFISQDDFRDGIYTNEISGLKKLIDNTKNRMVFKERNFIEFSKDTSLNREFKIDGDKLSVRIDIPHYNISRKWESEGRSKCAWTMVQEIIGKPKFNLNFKVNGDSIFEKFICGKPEFYQGQWYEILSDSLVSLKNGEYTLNLIYRPRFVASYDYQVGFLCTKGEGNVRSYGSTCNIQISKPKKPNFLVKTTKNDYSIIEQ